MIRLETEKADPWNANPEYTFDPNKIPIEFIAPVPGVDCRKKPVMNDMSPIPAVKRTFGSGAANSFGGIAVWGSASAVRRSLSPGASPAASAMRHPAGYRRARVQ